MDQKTPSVAFKKFKKPKTLKRSSESSSSTLFTPTEEPPAEGIDSWAAEDENERSSKKPKQAPLNTFSSKDVDLSKNSDSNPVGVTFKVKDSNLQKLGVGADESRMYTVLKNSELYDPIHSSPDSSSLSKDPERSGEYKGISAYKTFAPKRHDDQDLDSTKKPKSRFGPVRAAQNVRVTSVIDYQPDICKDYKQTGFCGYGDSCKFLHDRGDYKSGWQLEKEWEESQANGGRREDESLWKIGDDNDDSAKKTEELPFACSICLKEFTSPVSTRCNHYFCESCALSNYSKNPKCFICGAATGGMFKPAAKLAKMLREKHARSSNSNANSNANAKASSSTAPIQT
ncbi:Zinc finger CCCH domain-containing protein 1 [Smittium mucronatum]|uniref:Pre-mRNA-splicing factor CWC24 n=1 Tax=Smittium mucronatum TaxID=133383 RepID=A0A1R0H106_9FUNG|nr:Zinc finger CCCH domain-containing protein 1 [Smittium mucronatum]